MSRISGNHAALLAALVLAQVWVMPAAATCPACTPSEQLVDDTVATTELFSACATLTAGPDFRVTSTGRATLLSGGTIALQNGAVVDALGELVLDAGPHVVPPEITSGPTLTLPANPAAPLAGLVELTTDVPSFLELGFDGGGDTWTAELGGPLTTHAAPALGFKPDTAYMVSATVTGENELACTPAPMAETTAALPADFPTFTVTSTPAAMEPGVTLFDVSAGARAAIW